jgi:transcription antitermination factor NusG
LEFGSGPHWYAVRTRSRHEKKVAQQTLEKGIHTFLPVAKEVHRWSDRKKVVEVPLFPCYVFVRIAGTGEARLSVLRAIGVVEFVGVQGRGIPIPAKQIEDIQKLVDQAAPFAPHPYLDVGEKVRIKGGSLDGMEGILLAKNADRSLVVSIGLIRKSLELRLAGYTVEKV